eukprot:7605817-Pyramimonas_sp.AAC.1
MRSAREALCGMLAPLRVMPGVHACMFVNVRVDCYMMLPCYVATQFPPLPPSCCSANPPTRGDSSRPNRALPS